MIVEMIKCPNCGAKIRFHDSSNEYRCDYCRTELRVKCSLDSFLELYSQSKYDEAFNLLQVLVCISGGHNIIEKNVFTVAETVRNCCFYRIKSDIKSYFENPTKEQQRQIVNTLQSAMKIEKYIESNIQDNEDDDCTTMACVKDILQDRIDLYQSLWVTSRNFHLLYEDVFNVIQCIKAISKCCQNQSQIKCLNQTIIDACEIVLANNAYDYVSDKWGSNKKVPRMSDAELKLIKHEMEKAREEQNNEHY